MLTPNERFELNKLYQVAGIAVGHRRHDRMVWAAERYAKRFPGMTTAQAYCLTEEALEDVRV